MTAYMLDNISWNLQGFSISCQTNRVMREIILQPRFSGNKLHIFAVIEARVGRNVKRKMECPVSFLIPY